MAFENDNEQKWLSLGKGYPKMFLATVLFLQSLQFQGKKICDNKLDNQRQDILYTNVEGEAVVLVLAISSSVRLHYIWYK